MTGQAGVPESDPGRAARLLLAERDALLPLLRQVPAEAFGRPTACPGWCVRDVLAHCSSALTRAAEGTLFRLYAGRPADPASYELTGARPAELVIF